jgi:WD40 repeat protein
LRRWLDTRIAFVRSPSVQMGKISVFREVSTRLVEDVVCVWREGGCVSQTHGLRYVRVAFSPDGQHIVSAGSFDNLVTVWSVSVGRRLRRWLDTRILFVRSPSVQMGNILFREVTTGWAVKVCSVSSRKEVASLAGHTYGQHILSREVVTGW